MKKEKPGNRVVIFIQARVGSSRLRAKVLKKIMGKEVLLHMVNRVKKAKTAQEVVVITSTVKDDDAIANLCAKNAIKYYRGSEKDLLDRHYQAAKQFKADLAVKIPSDCPLADWPVIDQVISLWRDNPAAYDYVSNYHPPTFPDGLDVEGVPFKILEIAWREATAEQEREHTTPFIWDNPARFRIGNIENPYGNMFLTHRWTLDYEEDFLFIQRIYEEFGANTDFTMKDILALLKKKPEIAMINHKHLGVNWYRHTAGKLRTVSRTLYKKNDKLNLSQSLKLLQEAKELMPCATQTLSKGYTQWSVGAVPLFIESAKGCEVTDVDGNIYLDYGMALGPFILGYNDPEINAAVSEQLNKGTMFTLPHPLEITAAREIVKYVPGAQMVRFGKNGSDVTSVAVKLARAYTNREKIIICGYHGWQDWYIASTERDAGIPKCLKKLVIPLKYNDLSALARIINDNKNQIAGLIMEPVGAVKPHDGYLAGVRKITKENNIVLIFDELFTGFRWSMGGAQEYFKVTADLACFGKAIANGFPVSCIAGKKEIMQKLEEVFYSFTYGGETLSLAAIVATLKKLKTYKVHAHIAKLGTELAAGTRKLIVKHKLEKNVSLIGYPFKTVFVFTGDQTVTPLEIKTFIQQEAAQHGILFIGYHLISYAHKSEHIAFTLQAYDEIFGLLKEKLTKNQVQESLTGSVVTQVFKNVGDRSSGVKD